jgi:hypothetical protein
LNISPCPTCGPLVEWEQIHAGFNNSGYAYCGRDGALVVWETFDPKYAALVGEKFPWMLTCAEKRTVEESMNDCPCGGRFGMDNPPRCPECLAPLPDLRSDPIYFIDFGCQVDPSALWKPSP